MERVVEITAKVMREPAVMEDHTAARRLKLVNEKGLELAGPLEKMGGYCDQVLQCWPQWDSRQPYCSAAPGRKCIGY